jgi:hypothetical protein
VDWVIVELRSATQPGVVVASQAAVLLNTGYILDHDGLPPAFNVPAGSYYVAFRHRNHLGVMTAQPVAFGNTPALANMVGGATPAFGMQAMKPTAGTTPQYALWCGNTRTTPGTQQVKYTGQENDRDPILTRIGGTVPTNTVSGYYPEDVNLDGVVKYTGQNNDRDPLLITIGSTVPTATRTEQLP